MGVHVGMGFITLFLYSGRCFCNLHAKVCDLVNSNKAVIFKHNSNGMGFIVYFCFPPDVSVTYTLRSVSW